MMSFCHKYLKKNFGIKKKKKKIQKFFLSLQFVLSTPKTEKIIENKTKKNK